MPTYDHTQKGWLHWLLITIAAVIVVLAVLQPDAAIFAAILAPFILLLALCFCQLRVRDDGDALAVRFGPIPLFGTRVPYRDIRHAEADRSALVDGWGVHWVPTRGWIFNIRGRDCVKLDLGKRTVRVGTDDPQGLAAFVSSRIA